ncbi:biotin--[acetyl-CoA-carboxylase] ligase [Lachnospiraceae bacterium NSJ-143]|nr:biotin--[acetyl-CoA-carboxylase] ligase [Lachnospiraceae bacterium NSJ-143]
MLKEKLLDYLKTSEDYVSGEKLGEILGVSRSAVWKEIRALRNDGYKIDAVTNRGYKINGVGDVINSSEIKTDCVIGSEVICFDEVVSTNEECKKLGYSGEKEGIVVVADNQTGGKGRLGRAWSSRNGEGVYMSVLLRPDISPARLSSITLCAGLAVCLALREDFGIDALIKWPNDIVVDGRKICGILTEMSGQLQKVDFVVVGIGININTREFPEEISKKASSLYCIAGREFKRSPVAKSVLTRFDSIYSVFAEYGFSAFRSEYEKYCVNTGKRVRIINRSGEFEATAVGVDDDGELIVLKDNGEKTAVFSGEVSVRGVY